MPATNCTANVPRKHIYAFSDSGATTLKNRIAALEFGLRGETSRAVDEGVSGLIHQRAEDSTIDRTVVSGPVTFNVRPTDARWLLPLILGTSVVSNVIKAGAACPFFRVGHFDQTVDQVLTYIDCIVSRATFSSSDAAGGLLQVALDVEASQETKAAGSSWPSSGITMASSGPLAHTSATFTVNGKSIRARNCNITIDNLLLTDEFYNSRYRGDFPSDGQVITVGHQSPYDTADDVALTNITGTIEAQIVYATANMSLTFNFPALEAVPSVPRIGGRRSRVVNDYNWNAVLPAGASASDSIMSVTIDDVV